MRRFELRVASPSRDTSEFIQIVLIITISSDDNINALVFQVRVFPTHCITLRFTWLIEVVQRDASSNRGVGGLYFFFFFFFFWFLGLLSMQGVPYVKTVQYAILLMSQIMMGGRQQQIL